MIKIENICRNYNIANNRRKTEQKYDLSDVGTKKFEELGCFDCDGHEISCPNYFENTPTFFKNIKYQTYQRV